MSGTGQLQTTRFSISETSMMRACVASAQDRRRLVGRQLADTQRRDDSRRVVGERAAKGRQLYRIVLGLRRPDKPFNADTQCRRVSGQSLLDGLATSASACGSSSSRRAVRLSRMPGGRPSGFPDWPFSNFMLAVPYLIRSVQRTRGYSQLTIHLLASATRARNSCSSTMMRPGRMRFRAASIGNKIPPFTDDKR